MAFVYPPIVSPLAERSEQLSRLVYELLDAHSDTERLVLERRNELHWRATSTTSGISSDSDARLGGGDRCPDGRRRSIANAEARTA